MTLPCFCCCAHDCMHDNRYVFVETVAVSGISLKCTCLLTFLRTEKENVTPFSIFKWGVCDSFESAYTIYVL